MAGDRLMAKKKDKPAADFTGYGGLGDPFTPKEEITDFSSARWPPKDSSGIRNIGNYFEVKRRNGNDVVVLRPNRSTSARIYGLSPNGGARTLKQMKLWVNEIIIGWGMEYTQAQGVYGKSFYPKHIKYNDVIVRGQTASQRHYDEIVDAVLRSHKAALTGTPDIIRFELPGLSYNLNTEGPQLYSARTPAGSKKDPEFHMYGALQFDGYIVGISAGHKKGVFNPPFELRFAVVAYAGDNLTAIKDKYSTELAETYRKSLEGEETKPMGAVFESGYGPGGNLGPKGSGS